MMLTDAQRMLRDSLREFMEEEIAPDLPEADRKPMTKEEAVHYQQTMGEMGVGPAADEDISSDEDGSGLDDPRTSAVVSEEVARVWPSLQVTLGMSFPVRFVDLVSERTRDALGDRVAEGAAIGCMAITEPSGGSDTKRPNTVARKDGDEYVLSGEKTWVSNAPIADVAMVVAWDEAGGHRDFFLVDRETTPFETRELDKLGWKGSPTGQIFLDDARIPLDNKLSRAVAKRMSEGGGGSGDGDGGESDGDGSDGGGDVPFFGGDGGGGDPLNTIFASMRNGMASISVGIMQAAFEAARDYATDRETFGKPIAGHQLVQEKLYDIRAALATSRQLTYHAADLIDAGHEDARMMSSLAKGYATEQSVQAASDALQIHGANGLSTEYPLERYYRDARTMTIPDGTTEIQKLIVGYELTGEAAYN